MLHFKGLFTAFIFFNFFSLSADEGAIAYNDFLICWQDHLEESILNLSEKIEKGEEQGAYQKLDSILAIIEMAQESIKERIPYGQAYKYQEAALNWWAFYHQVFSYDYREILKISFGKDLQNKNIKRLNGFVKNIQVAEKFAMYEFKVAQKKFALKYDLHLQ